jgi:hypothetical protein
MLLQILVYRRGVRFHTLVWTVKAKSVKQAEHRVASLVRQHAQAHPDCPGFDAYTISSRRPGNGLWRVTATGDIPNGAVSQPPTQTHGVAS